MDACPKGGGGIWWGKQFYRFVISPFVQSLGLPIGCLEAWNLLVAMRLWATEWSGQLVLIFSDNAATVAALCSGRAQDPIIRGCCEKLG